MTSPSIYSTKNKNTPMAANKPTAALLPREN